MVKLKATGVVRRIDELGRIVIPKELRKTMRIKEGESLEIFIDGLDRIVLKKYSPVLSVNDFIVEYVESMNSSTKKDVVVTDNESIVATAGGYKKDLVGKKLSMRLEEKISKRATQVVDRGESIELVEGLELRKPAVIKPINVAGDIVGSVIISGEREISDLDKIIAEFSGTFLSRYLEG